MHARTIIGDRTRMRADPVRNFKFQVQLFHSDDRLQHQIAKMGFMSVEGISMNTEMVPYREGGWNTNPHKLPGQTDFAPLTMSAGVFYTKPGMWNLAKQMFAVQWGQGTIGMCEEYRFDMAVRILDHPVTDGPGFGLARATASTVPSWPSPSTTAGRRASASTASTPWTTPSSSTR